MIETVARWLAEVVGTSSDFIRKAILTALVVAAYIFVRRAANTLISKQVDDAATRFRFVRAARLGLVLASLAVVARVWFQGDSGIGTWIAFISAGVAVSLQDPLESLAGWVYVVTNRPFRVGDRVQIGEHAGDVVDIRPFSFTLLEIGNWVNADQSTGRLIHVPNGWLFKHSVAGYDHGFPFIWNEIAVTVTFESDWRAAKRCLEGILDEHAEKVDEADVVRASEAMHIQFARTTPVVWVDTVGEGVRLTMRYLCRPRTRRVSTSQIWEAILDGFARMESVDFAYPTVRRFDLTREGKPPQPPSLPDSPKT
ncbi:MAG: mechanosensitive ion channel family protein [Polyangiaceae bacterium]